LTDSLGAKLLAVRRVTQENDGKNTPGVDGKKSLDPEERMDLARTIRIGMKSPEPIRRVYIPKPGTDEKRPLGIPTIQDRAVQALALLALEPEWEAKFDPNSYGFRPGRSCQDAIEAIHSSINKKPKYVLDGDIRKCFDRINHEALLKKIDTFPVMERQIRQWLKAGVVDEGQLFPTDAQRGIISPLLANIALNGMEKHLKQIAAGRPAKYPGGGYLSNEKKEQELTVVRYADDFVVLHPDLEIIQLCKEALQVWLAEMGLELHPDKTRITHTKETAGTEKAGFTFLGFLIRQVNLGKHRIRGNKLAQKFRTFSLPSKKSMDKHKEKIREIFRKTHNQDAKTLTLMLNRVIPG